MDAPRTFFFQSLDLSRIIQESGGGQPIRRYRVINFKL